MISMAGAMQACSGTNKYRSVFVNKIRRVLTVMGQNGTIPDSNNKYNANKRPNTKFATIEVQRKFTSVFAHCIMRVLFVDTLKKWFQLCNFF